MKLDELKKKSVLVLGLGQEGKDTLKFLKKIFPEKNIGRADKNLGKDYLKKIAGYDVIIKSPGIPVHEPSIEKAHKEGKITSQTEIFFDNCQGLIIGVTGTKGKGTTAVLIHKILKEAGLPAYLVGNIGKPALSHLLSDKPDNIYVYEISSHQSFKLKKSPQIAVFLNIYPDHLDYFKNLQEYILAKSNIVRHQTKDNYLIYNSRDKTVAKIAKLSKARKVPISGYSDILLRLGVKKPPISLLGKHNLLNIAAAFEVAKLMRVRKEKFVKAVKSFKTRTHRLEYIGRFRGIEFYNDSASTVPESTIAAIETIGKRVETIILGGSEKGSDFNDLAKVIKKSKIKNAILFPTTGKKILQALSRRRSRKGRSSLKTFFTDNMADAVKWTFEHTQKGKICLLSPASASFSVFRDYKERGDLFKKYVKKYGRAKT